jgi:hypothetical protein
MELKSTGRRRNLSSPNSGAGHSWWHFRLALLEGAWQITYDNEAKQLLIVGSSGERLSVNAFLALNEGTAAEELEGLIVDMFSNTPEDINGASGFQKRGV